MEVEKNPIFSKSPKFRSEKVLFKNSTLLGALFNKHATFS